MARAGGAKWKPAPKPAGEGAPFRCPLPFLAWCGRPPPHAPPAADAARWPAPAAKRLLLTGSPRANRPGTNRPALPAGGSRALVTRSLATRKRTPRWRGATVGLISLRRIRCRPSAVPFFSVAVLRIIWPDTKGTSPLLRFGAGCPNFFDRRFAYFLTKNLGHPPCGLLPLVLGPLISFRQQPKKRGGETKRGAGTRSPSPTDRGKNHEHPTP